MQNHETNMKKKLLLAFLALGTIVYLLMPPINNSNLAITTDSAVKKKKKTQEERALYAKERELFELAFQIDPKTGKIPREAKLLEYENSLKDKQRALLNRVKQNTYTFRGPSNLGGRTRAFAFDVSDNTSNTILAGGVSSGVFRTTDGGSSWTKVSPNDDIHNVTCIAQDPRPGFQNIWYFGTGEWSGNSASLGSAFRGRGIWKSTDSGLTWTQIPATDSSLDVFDSHFDYIHNLAVHPTSGDLLVAATGKIYSYDGTNFTVEVEEGGSSVGWSDVVVGASGQVYAAIDGTSIADKNGVWTSATGNGSWTRIAENNSPADWSVAGNGRIVLAIAPSNEDIVYALYDNGNRSDAENNMPLKEADLWQYNANTGVWTDYSAKLPDEPGDDLDGNDPFAIQGAYDLVVSVKPDDENFVVIGGTNVYKIEDITNDAMFTRIGGYNSNTNYALYSNGGDTHHPDIHALVFDPSNNDVLYSGTDGGVHKTTNVLASTVVWDNLNNNYKTYQYYHVALDPDGSDIVLGGAQDNGTTYGGVDVGFSDKSTMDTYFGGDGVAVALAQRGEGNMQFYYGSQNGNIRTNLPSFRSIKPDGSGNGIFVTYFYLDPDNTEILYYASDNYIYRTIDAVNVTSATWDRIGNVNQFPANDKVRTLATTRGAYDANTSYLLIGTNEGRIKRLDDPKNAASMFSLKDITPTGATTSSGTIVSGLAIHPTNPDIVLATYSNYGITNIFLTTDATAETPTWTEVEQNLNIHSIRSAAIADVLGQTVYYVGTARGLYKSLDPTSSNWNLEGINDMGMPLVSSLVYRPSDQTLLVGTHGNGMYETTVNTTLSVKEVAKNSFNATVYPNPTTDMITLNSPKITDFKNVKYIVSDLSGRTLKKDIISKNNSVDVRSLKSGVYILTISDGTLKQSVKFIKE